MAIRIRPLAEPGDLGWVVMAHGEVYAEEFGWDTTFEALVARIVADYAAADVRTHAGAWIAEADGRRVGCVFCVPDEHDPRAAKLRILLVTPDARGSGLGGRLVDTCIAFARDAGFQRLRLWTNHPLVAARRVYLERGFRLVAEERHRSFGADLVGQTYELDLLPLPPDPSLAYGRGGGHPRPARGEDMDARVGDVIEVSSVQVGQAVRRGTVTEIVSTDPAELRVAWDDGHESVLYPTGGMVRVVERADSDAAP